MCSVRLVPVVGIAVFAASCAGSGASQKPFDQMTAEEHRVAAAREHRRANDAFAKITGANIVQPDVLPDEVFVGPYDWPGVVPFVPYPYDPSYDELGDPDTYVAWPRVTDPSETYEDAASEHRANALRHEREAARLEGRPSPQPLPPPHEPLLPPDELERG